VHGDFYNFAKLHLKKGYPADLKLNLGIKIFFIDLIITVASIDVLKMIRISVVHRL